MRRAAAAVAVVAALAGPAGASGLSTPMIGSAWGTAVRADAGAAYWNPAMLARLERPEILGSLSLLLLNIGYERERLGTYQHADGLAFALPLEPGDVDPSKTGTAESVSATQVLPTGGAFFAVPAGERVVAGVGVYAPYGAGLSFPEDGPQRWGVQSATILALYVTPAVGVKVTDRLSLGVGASLVVGSLAMDKVVDLAGTELIADALANPPISQANDFGEAAPTGVRELDVMSRPVTIKDALALSWSFNAGLAWEISDAWRLGLTYTHGAPLTFEGRFFLNMDDDYFTEDLASQGLQYPAMVVGDAFVSFPLPKSLRLSVGWRPAPRWDLTLTLEGVRWSEVEAFDVTLESEDLAQPTLGLGPVTTLAIPRRWRDSVQAEVLAAWQPSESLHLGLRAGYHSGSSPDATADVASPDGHRLRVTPMLEAQLTDALSLGAEVDVQVVVPRTVRTSDYDLGNGRYTLLLVNAGGTLRYRF